MADGGGAPPTANLVRLEHFLDAVLRQSLVRTLKERDDIYVLASQCAQLRQLFEEMRALSVTHSFLSSRSAPGAVAVAAAPTGPPQRNSILVDLGSHFYMQAHVHDSSKVHVNIGCGVVLPMATDEAEVFLHKKEKVLRDAAQAKTRESLRLKYRIRLVMEAIGRLHERTVLGDVVENRCA